MQKLNFSYNWNNKLDNKVFTTLRLSGRHNIGDRLNVCLTEKKNTEVSKGVAEVVDKKRITLDKINDWVAFLDTGYDSKECKTILKRMYRKINDWETRPIYYYLLKYT